MRHTPHFLMTDPEEVKRLIRIAPWATFVSPASSGLVASHYPVLLEEDREEISIVSHFGKPDDRLHELGEHEILVIIQGPHDYVSPSWYEPGDLVATWNHVTAHLYGVPEILGDEENYQVLCRLTDHFEQHYPGGRSLSENEADTRRQAKGTVGVRLRVRPFDARAKLSQNKSAVTQQHVTSRFEGTNPDLAREMRRAQGARDVRLSDENRLRS